MVSSELSVMEKILCFLEERNPFPESTTAEFNVREVFAELGVHSNYYRPLDILRGLELIKFENGKMSRFKIENKGECDTVSFLQTLIRLGLTNTDMKVLVAKGDNPEEIAQQTGLLVNEVKRRESNILFRLKAKNLRSARMKFTKMKNKIPA